MLSVRRLPSSEWPSLAAGFRDLSYEQSAAYAVPAAARIGGEVEFLALERDGVPVAACAVRVRRAPGLRRGIAWIASGPLSLRAGAPDPPAAEMTAILSLLREELAGRQGHILRLRLPATHRRPEDEWRSIAAQAGLLPSLRANPYRTFAVDLSQDEETRMKALHGKWRGHLRNALKSGMEVERGRASERDLGKRFRALYDEVRESKGFGTAIPPEFFFDLDGSDFTHEVLVARKDGADAAAVVTCASGGTAVYLFGATAPEGRRLRAGYLLNWTGMNIAAEEGRSWYDLGGVDEAANPDVYHFKQRTGGVELEGAGPFEAKPDGVLPRILEGLEDLRARLKRPR